MANLNDFKKAKEAIEKGFDAAGDFVADRAKDVAKGFDDAGDFVADRAKDVAKGFDDAGDFVADKAKVFAKGANDTFDRVKDGVMDQLDQDKNGEVDLTDVIIACMKTPGIRVDRAEFLKKELFKNHPQNVIDKAIETTPALAGISSDEIEKIAKEVIKFERYAVSGISVALGMPGGAAMIATIPADFLQYYAYMLRAAQKMMYLYGFPQIQVSDEGVIIDTETINCLMLCLGVMFGVAGAGNAIKALAKALATGVKKELMKKALTKGTIYPIVKKIMKWFGVKLTKEIFTGVFEKYIPIVGGVIGGGLTFFSFKPCCNRLRATLQDTMLSNPDFHVSNLEEERFYHDIKTGADDAEYEEIE